MKNAPLTFASPTVILLTLLSAMFVMNPARGADSLDGEVLFHASFDRGFDADKAKGDAVGRVMGNVETVEGIKGKAVVVGGKGWLQYAIEGNMNKDGGAGSIEMWVKPLDWGGPVFKEAAFFGADYDNTGAEIDMIGMFRLYNIGTVPRLTFIGGPYPDDAMKNQAIVQTEIPKWQQGEWHHLVVTWDGLALAMYIDGEQTRRHTLTTRLVPVLGNAFTVGAKPWVDSGDTAIDEVTIYKTALLPEEVAQRYRTIFPGGPR